MKRYTQEEIRELFVKYMIEAQGCTENDARIAATSLFTLESYSLFVYYDYEGDEIIDGVVYEKYSNTTDFSAFRTFTNDVGAFVFFEYKDSDGNIFFSLE